MTKTYAVPCTHTFTAEEIGYLLAGATENGGYSPWLGRVKPIEPEGIILPRTKELHWTLDTIFIESDDFAFTVNYDDPDEDEGSFTGVKTITHKEIVEGLAIMAAKYPDHWADAVADNADAGTYDVAMQCIVLGDVIYG